MRTPQQAFVLWVPALTVFVMTAFAPNLFGDGDTFWHLAAGESMLDNRTIITSDSFSHTFAGQPWRPHEWLSEIVMAAIYRAFGWQGLYLTVAGTFGGTALLLTRLLLKYLQPIPALYLCSLALVSLKQWMIIRPHVFSLLLLAFWLGELLNARSENRSPRWLLLPIIVLWANLHASFVLALGLTAVFAVEAIISEPRQTKAWGVFLGAISAATLLNPAGIDGLLFPLLFSGGATTAMIAEWQGSQFNGLTTFEVSILGVGLIALLNGPQVPWLRVLLFLGFLHLALEHWRFVPILAIAGAMLLAEPIGKALKAKGWETPASAPVSQSIPIAVTAALALMVAATSFTVPRDIRNGEMTPLSALAATPPEIAAQPVFNDWVFGGYLIFTGAKPFIDGRAELYGETFIADYLAAHDGNARALEATIDHHGIVWTLLKPGTPANTILDLLPGWCRTYADEFAVVHIKRDANPALCQER